MYVHDRNRICARTRVLWQKLGDESVLLDIDTGTYYGLNGVGTLVWNLIQSPQRLADVRDAIVGEFEVDREVCERDLRALVRELVRRRLVQVQVAA